MKKYVSLLLSCAFLLFLTGCYPKKAVTDSPEAVVLHFDANMVGVVQHIRFDQKDFLVGNATYARDNVVCIVPLAPQATATCYIQTPGAALRKAYKSETANALYLVMEEYDPREGSFETQRTDRFFILKTNLQGKILARSEILENSSPPLILTEKGRNVLAVYSLEGEGLGLCTLDENLKCIQRNDIKWFPIEAKVQDNIIIAGYRMNGENGMMLLNLSGELLAQKQIDKDFWVESIAVHEQYVYMLARHMRLHEAKFYVYEMKDEKLEEIKEINLPDIKGSVYVSYCRVFWDEESQQCGIPFYAPTGYASQAPTLEGCAFVEPIKGKIGSIYACQTDEWWYDISDSDNSTDVFLGASLRTKDKGDILRLRVPE